MRILVTSTSGIGHIHPMVPLATELRAAGHEVVWATARQSCARTERLGFRSIPAGLDGAIRKEMLAARAPRIGEMAPRRRRTVALPLMFGEIAAPAMRDELQVVFDSVRPQLVVHELAELAAAPMAIARGIPHVTVGFGGALSDELASLVADSVAPLWALEGVQYTPGGFNGDLLLHPFPRSMDTPRTDGPSLPMRPLPFDVATVDHPPEWVEGFGADRPGVYVTFGTEMARAAPWAAIFTAMADLQVDVVATIGKDLDPAALGPLPSNVRIAPFVPQRFLLERAAAVVSHAGAGTLIGAAAAGRMQLSLPLSADQWENADLLAATGAGLTLEPHERDAATIGAAVERLLASIAIRAAAERVRAAFAEMPHPRDVVAAIERLAPRAHRSIG
jgi:UDP:flavonoid glycosyltransferase YjiC (YdhE family)